MGRIVISSAEEWLKARQAQGIGGSEAASIVNANRYKSNVQLWEEKTGAKLPEDISDNPAVQYGKEAEKHLRALFTLDFPLYAVEYHEFDILFNDEFPFIFATLDGELTDQAGRRGILEIKTTQIQNSGQWAEWEDKVPDNYFVQLLHQFLATGYDFAILKAQIKYIKNTDIRIMTKHYFFERSELENDLKYLLSEEIKFWRLVQERQRPNLQLPEI